MAVSKVAEAQPRPAGLPLTGVGHTTRLPRLAPDSVDTPQSEARKAIGRFGMLQDGLYRGRQPKPEGFQALARLGVNTIVCLRTHPQEDRKGATRLGFRVIELPLPSLGKPTVDQGMRFLSAVSDPANGKVFFHCTHGADRTGAAAAIYRICVQGWGIDRALAEMKENGCHWAFQQSKVKFVKEFAAAWNELPEARRAEVLHRPYLLGAPRELRAI